MLVSKIKQIQYKESMKEVEKNRKKIMLLQEEIHDLNEEESICLHNIEKSTIILEKGHNRLNDHIVKLEALLRVLLRHFEINPND